MYAYAKGNNHTFAVFLGFNSHCVSDRDCNRDIKSDRPKCMLFDNFTEYMNGKHINSTAQQMTSVLNAGGGGVG